MIDYTPYHAELRLKTEQEQRLIWDELRRKWLVLQPEEMVRQLLVQYLIRNCGYNRNRMQIERGVKVNQRQGRFDLLVLGPQLLPFLLVECKAPTIMLTDDTLRQAARYNLNYQAPFLAVTNGHTTLICQLDHETGSFAFQDAFPDYPPELQGS